MIRQKIAVAFIAGALWQCSSRPAKFSEQNVVKEEVTNGEKLMFRSHDTAPAWRFKEVESDDKFHYFTGLSAKVATEKLGREDALNNNIQNVVKYYGVAFKEKLESIMTSYKLDSEIVDPTNVQRKFSSQVTDGLAKRVKPKEWYVERWQNNLNENWFQVYLFATVPVKYVKDAYDDQMDKAIDDFKKKRDRANEVKAKRQYQNAMDAFKKAKEDGFDLRTEELPPEE
jgi:hypothetical protein